MEKEFYIHMNDPSLVEKMNGYANCKKYKTIEEQVEDFYDELEEILDKNHEEERWYFGDSLKITIKLEYEPEDR